MAKPDPAGSDTGGLQTGGAGSVARARAGVVPDGVVPDGVVPDGVVPDGVVPDGAGSTSDGGVAHVRGQPPPPRVRAQLLLFGTGLGLFVLGAVLGIVGSFLNGSVPRVFGVGVPVGIVLAVVGNVAAGLLGTRGTGSRLGGALPAVAWFTVVLLFGTLRSEGDLIVTGDGHGVAFIVLGAVAACVGLLASGGRSRTPRPPPP